MPEYTSVMTRKGQVTLPAAIRKLLALDRGDTVRFKVEGQEVRLIPEKSSIHDYFMMAPALTPPRDWKEVEEIAHEEQARTAVEDR